MRVVHVHRIRGIGGSERHLLTLLPAVAERGVEVAFAGLDDPAWDAEPFYRQLGVERVRLPCPHDADPRLVIQLRRALRALRPDVVHTHLVHADVYGAVASLGAPWALVTTKHNDDPFRTGPFRFVERALARRSDSVVAITHALARFTVERVGLPAEKVTVVHYGLDALPEPWREDVAPPAAGRLLVAIARLVRQKGIDVAVRALAEIRPRHPDVRLAVLGEGPERAPLEALARSLGVEGALLLPGRVGDPAAWLRRADLLVHPARWEGFGLALLEAMLAAKPVVASSVSSVPEIVADGVTGLLVPPDDPPALARAVDELLQDAGRRERLGAAALDRARAEFSVARVAEATLGVYERALAARRSGKNSR